MCKKVISLFLVAILFSLTTTAFAAPSTTAAKPLPQANVVSQQTEYLTDGSKIITTTYEQNTPVKTSYSPNTYSATSSSTYTKTAYTECRYVEAGGSLKFIFTLCGNFIINPGIDAYCTDSWVEYTIYDSGWKCASSNDYYSNYSTYGTTYGSYTFNYYWLGIMWKSTSHNLSVSVNSDGVVY